MDPGNDLTVRSSFSKASAAALSSEWTSDISGRLKAVRLLYIKYPLDRLWSTAQALANRPFDGAVEYCLSQATLDRARQTASVYSVSLHNGSGTAVGLTTYPQAGARTVSPIFPRLTP